MNMRGKCLVFLFLLFLLACQAQKGALDLSFNPGTGLAGGASTAFAVAMQPDGKIIIGGYFETYNGHSTGNLARLMPDGELDTTFNAVVSANNIRAVAVQPDGKILIGGEFAEVDTFWYNYLARLNSDGTVDTSFNIGTGFNAPVRKIIVMPDGKILAAGWFTTYNNQYYGRLVRLNADGSADTSFQSTPGATNSVEAVVVQPDGKLVIGGDFSSYNNDTLFRLARTDSNGLEDPSYDYQWGGADKVIYGIALEPDTSAIIAGNFATFDLQARPSVAKIDRYGNLTLFANSLGANSEVDDVQIAGSNQILISGNFSSYGGVPFSGIASMDAAASPDPTFQTATGSNIQIFKMALQPDGKILIVGSFSSYNGASRNGVARLYNCNTPQPGAITGDTTFTCPGSNLTFSINPVPGASNYVWSLPNGWTGSSDSTSISVITSDTGGVISVQAYGDSCGNSAPTTLQIQRIPTQGVPVCLVTVDSQSLYNIIIWEKPQTNAIDSFFIYRQDSTYIFTKIAAIPYASLSEYDDTAVEADPNSTAHQYKISILDTCGTESVLSDYHSTIFLQDLGNGNLLWSPYQIENSVNPVVYYRVYRDTAGNGNFVPLNTSIPGGNTSFTDVDAAQYPNVRYVLDVDWGISCTPTRSVNTTRSNIKKPPPSGASGVSLVNRPDAYFEIYPNPNPGIIQLRYQTSLKIDDLKVLNILGQVVYHKTYPVNETTQSVMPIDIQTLSKGIYELSAETNMGTIIRKLVIQ